MERFTIDQINDALQAAHDVVCSILGLNPEEDSTPVSYNGPCGLELHSTESVIEWFKEYTIEGRPWGTPE